MPNPEKHYPFILEQRKPWADNEHLIWLVSTVSLSRNIDKYFFPSKLDTPGQKQIGALLNKATLKLPELQNPKLLAAEKVTPIEKEFLMEHFLTTESFQNAQQGQSLLVDDTGRFLGSFNINDHVQLMYLDTKEEIEATWSHLVGMETKLGNSFTYSFSPKFGFLTSDPMLCGTGLNVAVFLQLSGLIHMDKLDEIIEKYSDENVNLTGMQGSPDEIIGDILVVQNNYTLGLTEENIISTVRNFCTKLQVEEKSIRKEIKESQNADMKDKISRAYAILMHSYQIEAIEALNALSLLKLGVSFDWVQGISIREINELFFNCRRAHLLCQYKEELTQEQIPHKRAEYIHSHLKNVSLKVED